MNKSIGFVSLCTFSEELEGAAHYAGLLLTPAE